MRILYSLIISAALILPVEGQSARFAAVLTDNMVLQQDTTVTLWGFAPQGEKVTVHCSWASGELTTVTGEDGQWKVTARTPKGDFSRYSVSLADAKGNVTVLKNILIGEVWLCSGQSNMEMILMSQPQWNLIVENSEQALAEASNPYLRVITIGRKESFDPVSDVITGGWKECTPENARWFSSVAYFFGKEISEKLNIPVGLVVSSYGGSPIHSWIPLAVLRSDTVYHDIVGARDNEIEASSQSAEGYYSKMAEWISESEKSPAAYEGDITLNLPVNLEKSAIGNRMGEFSLTRTIDIPCDSAGCALTVSLGTMDDLGRVYFNGELCWEEIRNSRSYSNITFTVPAGKVKAGANIIEARVLNILWGGGLTGPAENMYYTLGRGSEKTSLTGEWHFRMLFDLGAAAAVPLEGKPLFSTAASLYNGMISPLTPLCIRGVIWYQGEENVSRWSTYTGMMADMIGAWRSVFGSPFPFYFVQIAPYQYGAYDACNAALLRQAQSRAEETIAGTGMVVTMDLGDPSNIHPARKREVGVRLAEKALANTYGQALNAIYPKAGSIHVRRNSIVISIEGAGSGLRTVNGKNEFEISSDGINYKPADVVIAGSKIRLTSSEIERPAYARYCWRDGAEGTVFNSDGLPLTSFSIRAVREKRERKN